MDVRSPSVPSQQTNVDHVEPRKFQIDLVEFAKRGNTIIYLETGSGKTHIAVMLIKEKLHQIMGSYKEGAKRSIFLACTVHLVEQQKAYLAKYMPPEIRVEAYIGARGVDFWSQDTWKRELEANHVLVMSPQILVDAMNRSMVDASRINVIVFDECHRAVENHPYRNVMRRIFEATQTKPQDRPLVLGLTASVLNDKGSTIAQNRSRLEELEKTFQAAVFGPREAVDSEKYKTCAQEFLVKHENPQVFNDDPLLKRLQELIDAAGMYAFKHKEQAKLMKNSNIEGIPLMATPNVADDFKKLFMDWLEAHISLGLIASRRYGEGFSNECARIEKDNPSISDTLKVLGDKGVILYDDIDRALSALGDDFDQLNNGMTDKVKRLIELLSAYAPKPFPSDMSIDERFEVARTENDKLRGIIFVQRRSTCDILLKILRVYTKVTGKLSFLRIGTVQGHTAPASIFRPIVGRSFLPSNDDKANESMLAKYADEYEQWVTESRKQAGLLTNFRNGTLNLLIATDVLEEGIDVPSCNLIVRFDRASTFRSYVQSRGRARSRDARFVFFASQADAAETINNLRRWHASESELIEVCSSRMVPTEEEVQESFLDRKLRPFAPFGLSGPVIDPNSAVSVVNRYVERYGAAYKPFYTMKSFVIDPRISVDTPVRSILGFNGPVFKYTPALPENVSQAWLDDEEDPFGVGPMGEDVSDLAPTLYKVFLYFPSVTSISVNARCLQSDYRDSVKEAKRSVCLKACRLLWEMGELDNDHLLPKPLDLILGIDVCEDDLDDEDSDLADDAYKNLRYFPHSMAKGLQNSRPETGAKLFLYQLLMTTVSSKPEHLITQAWNPSGAPFGVGLLSRKLLPEVEDFELFPKQANVRVSLKLLSESNCASHEKIALLESFYANVIVRHVLEIDDPLIGFDSKRVVDGPLYVPIDNGKKEIAWDYVTNAVRDISSWRTTPPDESRIEAFEDAVVVSDYDTHNKYYVVLELNRELNPDSAFAKDGSYRNYVKVRYERSLRWANQPMLRCDFMTRLLFMLRSRFGTEGGSSGAGDIREVNLIPELCRISPVPASLWLQMLLIPSAHRRLDCFMKAAELRKEIGIGRDVDGIPKRPILRDIAIVAITLETSMAQSLTLPSPPVTAILEGITAKQTNELFDYERYETLGDAMLKLVASLDLFLRWPNETEGQLTSAKVRLISNGYLERLNTKKKINEFWNVAPLLPRETWLPPLFFQPDYIDQLFLTSNLPQNEWDVTMLREHVKANGFASLSKELVAATIAGCKEAVKCMGEIRDGATGRTRTSAPLHRLQNNFLVKRKVVADVVESLAGVHLAWSGLSGGWKFFKEWAGMPLFEWEELASKIADPTVNDNRSACRAGLLKRVEGIQTHLKYQFKDPMFLVQAVTHPSYFSGNVWTRAYERLEFLGDAVLDYLVTVIIFDDPRIDTSEKISDLRSALTNNETLACIAVENFLHTYLLVTDEKTVNPIRRFADFVRDPKIDWKNCDFTVPVGGGTEYIKVPKSLADVQEALIGAVFLDSGLDLEVVWRVFEPWFHEVMEAYSTEIPCNPVKMAVEKLRAEFTSEERDECGRAVVTCKVKLKSRDVRCTGVGENVRSAKIAAANEVLRESKRLGFL